jgi:hypothetical protein
LVAHLPSHLVVVCFVAVVSKQDIGGFDVRMAVTFVMDVLKGIQLEKKRINSVFKLSKGSAPDKKNKNKKKLLQLPTTNYSPFTAQQKMQSSQRRCGHSAQRFSASLS